MNTKMKRVYRIAVICGFIPLLVGISIFVIWLITRSDWLMLAGLLTIYGGIALFVVGAIALFRFWFMAHREPDYSKKKRWIATVLCFGLLLINFPVALGIVNAAIRIETRYTVVIRNASSQPVNEIRIFGGGCSKSLNSIRGGGTGEVSFWIEHDGQLQFEAVSGGRQIEGIVDGYVTNGEGGYVTITIKPDHTISIHNPREED